MVISGSGAGATIVGLFEEKLVVVGRSAGATVVVVVVGTCTGST